MKQVINTEKALRSLKALRTEKEAIERELKNIEENASNILFNPEQIALNTGISTISGLANTLGLLKTSNLSKGTLAPLLQTTLKTAGKVLPIKQLTRMWLKAQLFNTAVFLGRKAGNAIKNKVKKAS